MIDLLGLFLVDFMPVENYSQTQLTFYNHTLEKYVLAGTEQDGRSGHTLGQVLSQT